VGFKLFITQHNLGAVNGSTEEGHRTSPLLHYPLRSDQPCAIYIQILPESPATKLPTTKQVQLRPPVAVTHNHSRMQNLTTPALPRGWSVKLSSEKASVPLLARLLNIAANVLTGFPGHNGTPTGMGGGTRGTGEVCGGGQR
jgi:hypothetical protein